MQARAIMYGSPWEREMEEISSVNQGQMGWKLEGLGLDVKWENTERDDWKGGISESGRNLMKEIPTNLQKLPGYDSQQYWICSLN